MADHHTFFGLDFGPMVFEFKLHADFLQIIWLVDEVWCVWQVRSRPQQTG